MQPKHVASLSLSRDTLQFGVIAVSAAPGDGSRFSLLYFACGDDLIAFLNILVCAAVKDRSVCVVTTSFSVK